MAASSDYGDIRVGSRVTIVDRFGKEHSGRAVMLGLAGWVLNMGGRHGTPAVATMTNFVRVSGGGGYAPPGGWLGGGREVGEANEALRAIRGGGQRRNYDAFTSAYLEAALKELSLNERSAGKRMEFTINELAPQTRDAMLADAAAFQSENYIHDIDASPEQAGYDFWLTRNGAGAGFWDGGWPEEAAKALTESAKGYGAFELYVGDDGMIYAVGHEQPAHLRRVKENGAREGVPVVYEACEDFPKLPAAIKGARALGFTHHYYEGEKAYVVKPADKPETGYVRRVVYHRKGKWHIAGGPVQYEQERLERMPASARPIPGDSDDPGGPRWAGRGDPEAMEDYLAVDNKGKKVGGPYKSYDDAKRDAEKAGGYVQYAFEGHYQSREAGRAWQIFYVVDTKTGAAVVGPIHPVEEADRIVREKYANDFRRYQVINSRFLTEYAFKPHHKGAVPEGPERRDPSFWVGEAAARHLGGARGDIDEHALEELDLYIENTAELYPQKQAIEKNIARRIKKGTYDARLAPKLWCYWVEQGAKLYAKEFLASPKEWSRVFPKPLRDKLCERIAEREHAEILIQLGRSEKPSKTAVRHVSEARDVAGATGAYATVSRDTKQLDKGQKLGAVTNARDVYDLLRDRMGAESQEIFLVLPLDLHGNLICPPVEVARGQRDRVAVDNSDVLRPIITTNAKGVVVAHNHPSLQYEEPSEADKKLTESIKRAVATSLPSVVFVDHVIVAASEKGGGYYSFTEKKSYKVK